jgi:hypothetical protein
MSLDSLYSSCVPVFFVADSLAQIPAFITELSEQFSSLFDTCCTIGMPNRVPQSTKYSSLNAFAERWDALS